MARRVSGFGYDYPDIGGGGDYDYGYRPPREDTQNDGYEGFTALAKALATRRIQQERDQRSAEIYERQNLKHIPESELSKYRSEWQTTLADPKLRNSPEGRYAFTDYAIKNWDEKKLAEAARLRAQQEEAQAAEQRQKELDKAEAAMIKSDEQARGEAEKESERLQTQAQRYEKERQAAARTMDQRRRQLRASGIDPSLAEDVYVQPPDEAQYKQVPVYGGGRLNRAYEGTGRLGEEFEEAPIRYVRIPRTDPRTWLDPSEAAQFEPGAGAAPRPPAARPPRPADTGRMAQPVQPPRGEAQVQPTPVMPNPDPRAGARPLGAPPYPQPRSEQELWENDLWNKATKQSKAAVADGEKAWNKEGAVNNYAEMVVDEYEVKRAERGLTELLEDERNALVKKARVAANQYLYGSTRGQQQTVTFTSVPGDPEPFTATQPFGFSNADRNRLAAEAWTHPARPYSPLYEDPTAQAAPRQAPAAAPAKPAGFMDRPLMNWLTAPFKPAPRTAEELKALAAQSEVKNLPPEALARTEPVPELMRPGGLFGVPVASPTAPIYGEEGTPEFRQRMEMSRGLAQLAAHVTRNEIAAGKTPQEALAAGQQAIAAQIFNMRQAIAAGNLTVGQQVVTGLDELSTPRNIGKNASYIIGSLAAAYATGGSSLVTQLLAAGAGAAVGGAAGQKLFNKPGEPINWEDVWLEAVTGTITPGLGFGRFGRVVERFGGPTALRVGEGILKEATQESLELELQARYQGRTPGTAERIIAPIAGGVMGGAVHGVLGPRGAAPAAPPAAPTTPYTPLTPAGGTTVSGSPFGGGPGGAPPGPSQPPVPLAGVPAGVRAAIEGNPNITADQLRQQFRVSRKRAQEWIDIFQPLRVWPGTAPADPNAPLPAPVPGEPLPPPVPGEPLPPPVPGQEDLRLPAAEPDLDQLQLPPELPEEGEGLPGFGPEGPAPALDLTEVPTPVLEDAYERLQRETQNFLAQREAARIADELLLRRRQRQARPGAGVEGPGTVLEGPPAPGEPQGPLADMSPEQQAAFLAGPGVTLAPGEPTPRPKMGGGPLADLQAEAAAFMAQRAAAEGARGGAGRPKLTPAQKRRIRKLLREGGELQGPLADMTPEQLAAFLGGPPEEGGPPGTPPTPGAPPAAPRRPRGGPGGKSTQARAKAFEVERAAARAARPVAHEPEPIPTEGAPSKNVLFPPPAQAGSPAESLRLAQGQAVQLANAGNRHQFRFHLDLLDSHLDNAERLGATAQQTAKIRAARTKAIKDNPTLMGGPASEVLGGRGKGSRRGGGGGGTTMMSDPFGVGTLLQALERRRAAEKLEGRERTIPEGAKGELTIAAPPTPAAGEELDLGAIAEEELSRPKGGGTADMLGLQQMTQAGQNLWRNRGRVGSWMLTGPRSALEHTSQLGPWGKAISESMQFYRDQFEGMRGWWSQAMEQAQAPIKTWQDRAAFFDAMEGQGTMTPEATNARAIMDDIARAAARHERFAEYLANYFPRMLMVQPDFAQQATHAAQYLWQEPAHKAKMQRLGAQNWNDEAAARYAAAILMFPGGPRLYGGKNPNLERLRTGMQRQFRKDPEVLFQYIHAAARSIAQAQAFDAPRVSGVARERFGDWKQMWSGLKTQQTKLNTQTQGRQGARASTIDKLKKALEGELGIVPQESERYPGEVNKEQVARDIVASTSLSLSFLNQPMSLADLTTTLASAAGPRGLAAAQRGMAMGMSPEWMLDAAAQQRALAAEQAATRAGSVISRGLEKSRSIGEELQYGALAPGAERGLAKLGRFYRNIPWMNWMRGVDRATRISADSSARLALPEILRRARTGQRGVLGFGGGATAILKSAGIDMRELLSLTDADAQAAASYATLPENKQRIVDRYARRITELAMQRARPGDLPKSWTTTWAGRWATMFVPFGYRQAKSMLNVLVANPIAFGASGLAAYLVYGGGNALVRSILAGYGMGGEKEDDKTVGEQFMALFGNRRLNPDSPYDYARLVAQLMLRAAPKPFAITPLQRLERGRESAGETALNLLGPGARVLNAGESLYRGFFGSDIPLQMSRPEYAARGAASALAELAGPAAYSGQLRRELIGEKTDYPRRQVPVPQSPGLVGRVADVARGEITPEQFGWGVFMGGESTLSRRRKQRRADIAKSRRRDPRERAKRYEELRGLRLGAGGT